MKWKLCESRTHENFSGTSPERWLEQCSLTARCPARKGQYSATRCTASLRYSPVRTPSENARWWFRTRIERSGEFNKVVDKVANRKTAVKRSLWTVIVFLKRMLSLSIDILLIFSDIWAKRRWESTLDAQLIACVRIWFRQGSALHHQVNAKGSQGPLPATETLGNTVLLLEHDLLQDRNNNIVIPSQRIATGPKTGQSCKMSVVAVYADRQ